MLTLAGLRGLSKSQESQQGRVKLPAPELRQSQVRVQAGQRMAGD